ncbi:MAG: hypothetical protein RIQ97_2420 [Pseudomonadota bacterium]
MRDEKNVISCTDLRQNLNKKRSIGIVDLMEVMQGVWSARSQAGFFCRLALRPQA